MEYVQANGWKMAESEDSDSGEEEDKALTADRRNEPEAESKKVYAVSDRCLESNIVLLYRDYYANNMYSMYVCTV